MDRIEKHRPHWRVKEWREHRGYTQEHLAELAGMTKSMISEIESGKKRLHDDHVAALCYALGLETEDLLRDPAEKSQVDFLKCASPEQMQQILTFASFVLGKAAG